MREHIKIIIVMLTLSTLITGCTSNENTQINSEEIASKEIVNEEIISESAVIGENINLSINSEVVVDTELTARDLEVGYEETTATYISFNGNEIEVDGEGATAENGNLKITKEGVYVVTGNLTDGQILIEADDTVKVQLVLDGVNIICKTSAPIYIKSADKVFITLKEGTENTLTDGDEYIQTDENTVDGVIFSKADLTLNGSGTLTIQGNYKHGILSKDDIVITGGNYYITAIKDAINGKDAVKIKDGSFTLSAIEGNGIQSKNNEDSSKGYVYIAGGELDVVDCQEGIEGTAIVIADGIINIKAMDDGLNASSGIESEGFGFGRTDSCYISISGGTININASGDGIDSNGSLYISGGTTYVSGPANSGNGGLDYDGVAEITAGTVVATSSAGMAQGFSNTSSQYSLLYNFDTVCEAGEGVILTDSEGNVIISYIPNKKYQSIVISSPDLVKDESYTLVAADQSYEITLSDIVTSNGGQGMSRFGGRGMNRPEGMERPEKMERPEGRVPVETPLDAPVETTAKISN